MLTNDILYKNGVLALIWKASTDGFSLKTVKKGTKDFKEVSKARLIFICEKIKTFFPYQCSSQSLEFRASMRVLTQLMRGVCIVHRVKCDLYYKDLIEFFTVFYIKKQKLKAIASTFKIDNNNANNENRVTFHDPINRVIDVEFGELQMISEEDEALLLESQIILSPRGIHQITASERNTSIEENVILTPPPRKKRRKGVKNGDNIPNLDQMLVDDFNESELMAMLRNRSANNVDDHLIRENVPVTLPNDEVGFHDGLVLDAAATENADLFSIPNPPVTIPNIELEQQSIESEMSSPTKNTRTPTNKRMRLDKKDDDKDHQDQDFVLETLHNAENTRLRLRKKRKINIDLDISLNMDHIPIILRERIDVDQLENLKERANPHIVLEGLDLIENVGRMNSKKSNTLKNLYVKNVKNCPVLNETKKLRQRKPQQNEDESDISSLNLDKEAVTTENFVNENRGNEMDNDNTNIPVLNDQNLIQISRDDQPIQTLIDEPIEQEQPLSPIFINTTSKIFRELFPPNKVSRIKAAQSFFHLLKLQKEGRVMLRQEIAFGDIFIDYLE